MNAEELRDIVRQDYLDDADAEFLWGDESLLRKFTEAQRQACNRVDCLYDDSTPQYTQITLQPGIRSYPFHQKVTVIERVLWNGKEAKKLTKDMADSALGDWRNLSGMDRKELSYIIQGRTISILPAPDANDIALSATLNLDVYRLPDRAITEFSQCFEIPSEFVPDLKYWVLHEAYKKQDSDTFDQERSDYYLQRFNQAFGRPVPFNVRQHQFETPRGLQIIPHIYNKRTRREVVEW